MTSKLIVNNIEADAGVSTITFGSEISASTFTGNLTGNVTGNVTSSSTSTFSSGLNVTGGSVGIGTDNPSNPLHISTSSSTPLLVESTGADSYIRFQNSGGSSGYIGYLNAQEMLFWVNGSERSRITSSGNIGIGLTNPTYSGVFGGSQRVLHISGTTAPSLRIQSSTANQGDLSIQAGNSGADVQISNMATDGDIVFYTHPSGSINEAARFTDSGNLKFPSGQGIDFSATADAAGMTSELLDDYEEGTWTPGLQLGSQSGSFNFTGNNGARYTKIGRVVHVNGIIEWQSHNLTAGVNLQVTGLPFTSASTNQDRSGISISYTSSPWTGISVYQQALRSETSATYMTFNYSNSTSGDMSQTFSWNHLDTTATFIFFGMYIV